MKKEINSQTITSVIGCSLKAVFIILDADPSEDVTAEFCCPDLKIKESLLLYNQPSDFNEDDSNVITISSEDSSGDNPPVAAENKQAWLLWNDNYDLRPGEFFYSMTVTTYVGPQPYPHTYIHNGRLIIKPKRPPRTTYKEYFDYPHNTKNEHE